MSRTDEPALARELRQENLGHGDRVISVKVALEPVISLGNTSVEIGEKESDRLLSKLGRGKPAPALFPFRLPLKPCLGVSSTSMQARC